MLIIKSKYLFSLISELVNKLQSVWYFTKLDLCWKFNNICIKPSDEWKAAFCTNYRLFELLVMFFSMTNSSTIVQTMMNNIFWDLIAEGIMIVYVDNILIFIQTLEKHYKAVH